MTASLLFRSLMVDHIADVPSDMSYWAVSDLNANELSEFVQLARSKYSQTTP